MAAVEEELHDAKAGYSSYCRRDEHAGCRSAQAKCSCTCHGRNGQAGPAPFKPSVAAVPTRTVDSLTCDQCGRSFAGEHGLGVHKARSHKTGAAKPPVTPRPPKPEVVTPVESDESWIVIIAVESSAEIRLEGIPFDGEADATRVRDVLAKVGLRCVVLGPTP